MTQDPNPYPKGTLAHDVEELHRAVGRLLRETATAYRLPQLCDWISRKLTR